ncbi:retrotransposable element Tf2, partial [Tanacetum coccineum]
FNQDVQRFEIVLLVEWHEARCGYPLEIPMWKWDEISMDFVTGFPTTQKRPDAIWVVVDRLTKSAHFLPIQKNYGIKIRSKFTSRFWKGLQKAWGTRLKFSTAFHPVTPPKWVAAEYGLASVTS